MFSFIISVLRVCGLALFGYMLPIALVAVNVPLDVWAHDFGQWIGGDKAVISQDLWFTVLGSLFALCLIFLELWLEPIKHLIDKIKGTSANTNPVIKRILPDITISQLYDYLKTRFDIKYHGMDEYDIMEKISLEIRDHLQLGDLFIWGRACDEYDELFDNPQNTLDRIEYKNWGDFVFTYNFTSDAEESNIKAIDAIYRGDHVKDRFREVQFNRAQIQPIWPEK